MKRMTGLGTRLGVAAMLAILLGLSSQGGAQIALPGGGPVVDQLSGTLGKVTSPVLDTANDLAKLADLRADRLARFVQTNRDTVEFDEDRQPARAHELLLLDPIEADLELARAAGFTVIEVGELDGLGVRYARLAVPEGTKLAAATRQLRGLLPGREISADQLHFTSGGAAARPSARKGAVTKTPALPTGGTVGVIDGGVAPGGLVALQAGFAKGAPRASAHARAIVSLLGGAGTSRILIADVYGSDPAGGGALAIAKALGWMAANKVPVVSISLVGPANPVLGRAVAAAQAKGVIVVAAVGNDGASSPLAYPASYGGVVAVTGIDGRGRVLFEAGRAAHLDYAAPGADLTAIGANGRPVRLRGTSYAAPLAAARIAANGGIADAAEVRIARADKEAVKGAKRTGRGVLCDTCRKGR